MTNRDDVKIISMHKTLPDDPRYPFSQPRGYVYAKNNITPGAAAFLGFTASPLGGEVVAIAREAEVKGIEPDVAGIAPVQPSPTPTDSPVAAVTPETIAQAPDTLPPDRVATPTDRPLRGATGFWGWLLPFGVLGTAWWLYSKREAENRTWLRQRETLEVLPSSRSPVIAPDLPSSQIVTPVIESEGIGVDPIASMPVVQDYPASPVLRPDLDTLPTAETLGIIPVGSDTEIIAPDLTDLPPEAPPSDPETFAAVPSPWDAVTSNPHPRAQLIKLPLIQPFPNLLSNPNHPWKLLKSNLEPIMGRAIEPKITWKTTRKTTQKMIGLKPVRSFNLKLRRLLTLI
ncbi:MAG: hypothetical protein HC825_11520 [Oscillatoriales cyanobacterium RM1_1_9]|nr:hypothetical protein [Oscillatoriales cyanobacterium RM1_1_9]